ncbi:MAG: glycine--tRNA ligase subunit beta, partial [Alphaproteobacteria bacterium]
TKPVSVAVALADKIDTLVGFWAIDQKPTGSKDPYALRRAALGVIRIILGNGLRLSLSDVFTAALALQKLSAAPEGPVLAADLMGFFADRLKVHLRDEGIPHDHVAAIFALGGDGDLVRLVARVKALGHFLASEDGGNLLTAYRRAANIVRVEEKKDGVVFDGAAYDPDLAGGDEAKLWGVLAEIERSADSLAATEAYGDMMTLFAQMRAPVDEFFTNVTVNVEDDAMRANRLRLLARIVSAMNGLADFSRISG